MGFIVFKRSAFYCLTQTVEKYSPKKEKEILTNSLIQSLLTLNLILL